MGPPEGGRLNAPMPPGTEQVLSVVWPLVASCPTFEAASTTVEYLCRHGVSREGLSVVVDEVPPPGAIDRRRTFGGGAATNARRRRRRTSDSALTTSRRYYVISEERGVRRARQLLAAGADAKGETFGVPAMPCVGQLSSRSLDRGNGMSRISRWSRWRGRTREL